MPPMVDVVGNELVGTWVNNLPIVTAQARITIKKLLHSLTTLTGPLSSSSPPTSSLISCLLLHFEKLKKTILKNL